MLLVKKATGPANVKAGDRVTFTVSKFNQEQPAQEAAARVNWLVKSDTGAALTNIHHHGPTWTVTIPESWSGQTIFVMPYMNSATYSISVKTVVAARPGDTAPGRTVVIETYKEDQRYYAAINGEPRFYVGTDVRYGNRRGLMNSANPYGPRYNPQSHQAEFGFWAHYLLPTINCESKGAFNCINTYDRACFTFGHMQFAAHTADANFVPLFRELLQLPAAPAYFPELALHNGRIHRRSGDQLIPLENHESTADLQTYLNPEDREVDPHEVVIAARFMGWCAADPQFVTTMANFAFRDQQQKLRRHAVRLPLDNLADKLVIAVMDILHQGRGKYTTIKTALNRPDPFDALLNIGIDNYGERIATLRQSILALERMGIVGHRVYSAAAGDFIPAKAA